MRAFIARYNPSVDKSCDEEHLQRLQLLRDRLDGRGLGARSGRLPSRLRHCWFSQEALVVSVGDLASVGLGPELVTHEKTDARKQIDSRRLV